MCVRPVHKCVCVHFVFIIRRNVEEIQAIPLRECTIEFGCVSNKRNSHSPDIIGKRAYPIIFHHHSLSATNLFFSYLLLPSVPLICFKITSNLHASRKKAHVGKRWKFDWCPRSKNCKSPKCCKEKSQLHLVQPHLMKAINHFRCYVRLLFNKPNQRTKNRLNWMNNGVKSIWNKMLEWKKGKW